MSKAEQLESEQLESMSKAEQLESMSKAEHLESMSKAEQLESMSKAEQLSSLSSSLPSTPSDSRTGRIWLDIEINPSSGCTWSKYTPV